MDDTQNQRAILAIAKFLEVNPRRVHNVLVEIGKGYRPLPGSTHRQILDCYGAINEYLDMSKENHG